MGQKIAIASSDGVNIDLHFAKASGFYIYEIKDESFEYIEYRVNAAATSKHDENEFERTLKSLSDCKAIIVSQVGISALAFIQSRGFRLFEASYRIDSVLERFIEKDILNRDL